MSVMSHVPGRGESRPWPAKRWMSSLGALGVAVVVGIGIFTFRKVEMRPPLHRWCWTEYLKKKTFSATPGDYQLREQVDQPGKQLMAFDADVVLGPLQGWLPVPFAPTPKARQAGGIGKR